MLMYKETRVGPDGTRDTREMPFQSRPDLMSYLDERVAKLRSRGFLVTENKDGSREASRTTANQQRYKVHIQVIGENLPATEAACGMYAGVEPIDGTYTVVLTDGHLTIRIVTPRKGGMKDQTILKYMVGPDNENDYVPFAFVSRGLSTMIEPFKRYRSNWDESRLRRAVDVLFADPESAGMEYALRSGKCYRCGRTLTVPASLHRGLGPDCAAKVTTQNEQSD